MGGSEEVATEVLEREETIGPQLAICLVSGGMDSCVTAAIAHEENDELAFLHVSYGQRTEKRERESFEALADHYKVKSRLVISLEHLAQIGGSSLTDHAIPVTAANLPAAGIPSSYVPFRNAHLLSAAVSWGEVIKATAIYIGAVAEDSSGYPDCRPEFYEAFQQVLDTGTKPETNIEIRTPVFAAKIKLIFGDLRIVRADDNRRLVRFIIFCFRQCVARVELPVICKSPVKFKR